MKNYHEEKPFLSSLLKRSKNSIKWNQNRKLEIERKIRTDINVFIMRSKFKNKVKVWVPNILTSILLFVGIFLFSDYLLNEMGIFDTGEKNTPNISTSGDTVLKDPDNNTQESKLYETYKDKIKFPVDLHTKMGSLIVGEPTIKLANQYDGYSIVADFPMKEGVLYISQVSRYSNYEKFNEEEIIKEMQSPQDNIDIKVVDINGNTSILINQDEIGAHDMIKIITDYDVYTLTGGSEIDILLDIANSIDIKK